jgi:hypothetical protein
MEEFNEMMSVIGDDISQLDHLKVPQRIKRESKLMEQLLNFYVTYIGGLSIERADSFFMRLYKPKLLHELIECMSSKSTSASIHIYGLQQYFYSKNSFFYAFVDKSVRSGKEKFFVPLEAKTTAIKSNVFSLTMFDEMSLLAILQDANPKICKLYIKNKALLERFQQNYSAVVSPLIQLKKADFISAFYSPFCHMLHCRETFISLIQRAFSSQEVIRLKDALYSFDLWIFRSMVEKLPTAKMQKLYTDSALLNILANLRELLPGFLLLYSFFLKQDRKEKNLSYHPEHLVGIFFGDILGLDNSLSPSIKVALGQMLKEFGFALELFTQFDDNQTFFSLLRDNWKDFMK